MRSQLASLRTERKTLEKRRDKVSKVSGKISSKLSDEIEDVNKKISDCAEALKFAVKGTTVVQEAAEISLQKEKGAGSDANMSGCISSLNSEVSRCDNKIYDLDLRIERLQQRIREEQEKALLAFLKGGN